MIPLLLTAAEGAAPAVGSAVTGAVHTVVNSVVGIFDPGKARDAEREARAEMWYQLANMGSVYAGRHVYGGRTLVYTVKEKGYYEDRWEKLASSNPYVAQQSQVLGALGIPDNPTDAEKGQMQQEIDAYNQRNIYAGVPGSQYPDKPATISFTPSGSAPAPLNPVSPAAQQRAQTLPTMVTTARAPKDRTLLYVILAVVAALLVWLALRRKH